MAIRALVNDPLWVKIKQHLDYELVRTLLNPTRTDITDDVRRGYLYCRGELDHLPQPEPEPESDDTKRTTMQMSDDPEDE